MDVHGLLVGDDLDPALDLRAVSTRFATQGSSAITSGMLAVLLGGRAIKRWWSGGCARLQARYERTSMFGCCKWLARPATRDPWFGGAESYSSRLAQQSSLPARAEATAAGYETRGEGHSRGNAVDSESGQFSTI